MTDSSLRTSHLHNWFHRMQAGDRGASEELLRAIGERMERLARRMLRAFPNVRRNADTGDVFQESVVRLLRTLEQLDPPPPSVRDFFRLAAAHIRRELLDLARRCGAAKRRGEVALPEGDSASAFDPPAADDDPDEMDRWRRFHEEVEKLPVEEREVIGLRFYHGWSEAEIAELFGVSDRTIRRYWAAGCARLVDALGAALPTP